MRSNAARILSVDFSASVGSCWTTETAWPIGALSPSNVLLRSSNFTTNYDVKQRVNFTSAGASARSAFISPRLKEPLRRLPQIISTLLISPLRAAAVRDRQQAAGIVGEPADQPCCVRVWIELHGGRPIVQIRIDRVEVGDIAAVVKALRLRLVRIRLHVEQRLWLSMKSNRSSMTTRAPA
jgi:hypothetical protein